MVDLKKMLVKASPRGFKFINQRKVIFHGPFGYCWFEVSYRLTKDDVVRCINSFIQRIHLYTDKPIRGDGMNFAAFKMYDLVPYLYTLINLYVHVRCGEPYEYVRSLPELKLTRFCHLPFEDEVIEVPKKNLRIEYVKVRDNVRGCYRYLSFVDSYSFCSDTLDNLISSVRVTAPYLFDDYNVRFESIL